MKQWRDIRAYVTVICAVTLLANGQTQKATAIFRQIWLSSNITLCDVNKKNSSLSCYNARWPLLRVFCSFCCLPYSFTAYRHRRLLQYLLPIVVNCMRRAFVVVLIVAFVVTVVVIDFRIARNNSNNRASSNRSCCRQASSFTNRLDNRSHQRRFCCRSHIDSYWW